MTSEQPITGKTDYSQGPEGGQMDFLLSVANGSVGAEVAMHAVKPLPDGTRIEIPKSPVTAPFIFYGRTYHVPADFQTEIIYTYYPNGTPVSPHLKLSVRVQFVPSRGNARIAHSSALDEKPPLVLNTSLQNPMLSNSAQVAVSTDSSYPVLNTLNLIIHNPANNPTIPFENPDGLTTDDDLPPITGAPPGPRLDRLYIYFPYGDTGGNLTTEDLAAAMTLSVASDNTSWDVSRMSAPDIGPYWILFPKSEYFMAPRESAGFVLTGLKTFNPADSLTHLELKKQVTGYAVETDSNSNISLVDAQPKILTFDTSQNDVPAGTSVDLSWTTWNAKTCSLGESEGLPANEQAHPVRPLTSGVYKLQAFSPSDKSVREFEEITVQPVKIDSFTADPPEGSRIGEEVTLKWQTSSAVTVDIAPDVGQVCEDAAGCNTGERAVHPTQRTQYVLSATGEGGLKTRDVVVFPLPRSWGKATSSAPWNTRDPPSPAYLQQRVVVHGWRHVRGQQRHLQLVRWSNVAAGQQQRSLDDAELRRRPGLWDRGSADVAARRRRQAGHGLERHLGQQRSERDQLEGGQRWGRVECPLALQHHRLSGQDVVVGRSRGGRQRPERRLVFQRRRDLDGSDRPGSVVASIQLRRGGVFRAAVDLRGADRRQSQ